MREIKFRYWDLVNKRFISDGDVYFVTSDCVLAGDLGNPPVVDITGNVIVSQYTGLKDKNGVEIYEGDIVEERWNNPLAGGENVDCYKVETAETSLIKMIHSSGLQQWDRYLYMRYKDVEVISNIYRNPELLEVKE